MHAHAHAHAHTHAHTADRWYKGLTTTKTHKEQDTCNENASTSNKGQKHSTKFNISEEKRRFTHEKKSTRLAQDSPLHRVFEKIEVDPLFLRARSRSTRRIKSKQVFVYSALGVDNVASCARHCC